MSPMPLAQDSLADRDDDGVEVTRCRSAETKPAAKEAPGAFRTASGTEVRMPSRDAAEDEARADAASAAWPVNAAACSANTHMLTWHNIR